MLSIVWKTLDGSEHLYGGITAVNYDAGRSVKFQIPGSMITIDSGTVYAMNENGKTIATYHLSGKKMHGPTPQHRDAPTIYPAADGASGNGALGWHPVKTLDADGKHAIGTAYGWSGSPEFKGLDEWMSKA